jgi:hypothetical protein
MDWLGWAGESTVNNKMFLVPTQISLRNHFSCLHPIWNPAMYMKQNKTEEKVGTDKRCMMNK